MKLYECAYAANPVAIARRIRIWNDHCFSRQLQDGAIGTGKVSLNEESFPTTRWISDGQ